MKENKAPRTAPDSNWRCARCGETFVVAVLARQCEMKHDNRK